MACKYSGMQFVSRKALDYAASKNEATPEGVWPPGGPKKEVVKRKPTEPNNSYGKLAEDGRYER